MIVMANTYEKCRQTRRNRVNSEQLQASCVSSGCIRLDFKRFIFRIQKLGFNLNSRCTRYYKSLLCEVLLIHTSIVTWKDKPLNVPWAAALLETEKNFRKIMGYRDLWMLKAALDPNTVSAKQAVA